jgi:hypothetical protein
MITGIDLIKEWLALNIYIQGQMLLTELPDHSQGAG